MGFREALDVSHNETVPTPSLTSSPATTPGAMLPYSHMREIEACFAHGERLAQNAFRLLSASAEQH